MPETTICPVCNAAPSRCRCVVPGRPSRPNSIALPPAPRRRTYRPPTLPRGNERKPVDQFIRERRVGWWPTSAGE